MQHKHLLPDDIDLLLDGDDSPAMEALRAHASDCDACHAELERAVAVTAVLERLPHAGPSAGFSTRVMAQVQVFEPWYVTLLDSLRRFAPRPGPIRVLASAGAGGTALTLTALAIWASFRADQVAYAFGLALARTETALVTAGGSVIADLFGVAALNAVRDGGLPVVALGIAILLAAFAGATLGLRGLLAVARRRGN